MAGPGHGGLSREGVVPGDLVGVRSRPFRCSLGAWAFSSVALGGAAAVHRGEHPGAGGRVGGGGGDRAAVAAG
ncbi:hypothetical protein ACFFRS_25250, partial [Saccharopolyspora hordei]|uniref:hypothetical protein n=1 Tax=Saccharopolyspora hordei TaxID=1838 RepID=UPI0035ED4BB5